MALRDEYEFQFDDLPKRSFSFFENTRTEFCDITFKVGDRSISAHRIILSAAMPFFYKVFSDQETADAKEKEIAFPDIDPDAFESLIEYAYKCKVKITIENVKMLLSSACILQVDEVKNACCQFLIDRLDVENVWDIRNYSSAINSPELTEKVDNFLLNNFSEIMMTQKFLNMPLSLLNTLICSDELSVQNEEVIFESALKWVKHCPEERGESLPDLLKNIRFSLLDVRYIKNSVAKEQLIRSSHECRNLVEEAIFYHFLPEERKEICNFPTSPRRFLTSDQKSDVKENLSICILFEGKQNKIHSFDLMNEKWKVSRTSGDSIPLVYFDAVVALNKKMYCFLLNVTQILDLERNSHSSCGGMKYPRECTGSVAHENKVFICGGYDGRKASNIVECFDPQTEDFIQQSCMNICRMSPAAGDYEEFIYILGGRSGTFLFNSVEKYNVKTGMWSTSSPMLTARASFGCCTLKDKMYVCGGYNKSEWISTAEVFNFSTNQWKFIASMKYSMRHSKLVSCCNKLYVFGDCNNYWLSHNNVMEIYEEVSNSWTKGPSLDKDLDIVGAAVIPLPFV